METRDRLLGAVRDLEPAIRAAGNEAETGRRVPLALVRQLAELDIFRMMVPRAFGGPEVDPLTAFEVVEAVSRIDGSIGWVVMIGAGTPALVASYLSDGVAREVFRRDPEAIFGGLIAPAGRAVAVEGGYRVSGRWPFASGCEHCAWLVSGCMVFDGETPRVNEAGQPLPRLMLLRAEDCTILDTWTVSGLRGTGSHDYTANDVFVPAGYSVSPSLDYRHQAGHLYDAQFVLIVHAAHALGVARHAIDGFSEFAARLPGRHTMAVRERPLAQLRAAEAEALVGSARAYILSATDDAWRTACSGATISHEQRALIRLAMTNAVQRAADAVDLMYDAAGAWSIYSANPLERCFRDIHVATQHVVVATPSYELIGKALLGVDPDAPPLL